MEQTISFDLIKLLSIFWQIDKDWKKLYYNYKKIKKYLMNFPKTVSNLQITDKDIFYQWKGNFIFLEKIPDKKNYIDINEYFTETNYLYVFFLLEKWFENEIKNVVKFFDFLEKNVNDKNEIINKLKKYEINDIEEFLWIKLNSYIRQLKKIDVLITLDDFFYMKNEIIQNKEQQKLLLKYVLDYKDIDVNIKDNIETSEIEMLKKFFKEKNWNLYIELNDKTLNLITSLFKKWIEDLYYIISYENSYVNLLRNQLIKDFKYDFGFSIKKKNFRWIIDLKNNKTIFTIRLIWKPLDLDSNYKIFVPDFVWNHIFNVFKKEDGLVIVSWPTWSGKTTFLISVLDYFNQYDKFNKLVYTIEDPIEYNFDSKNYYFIQKELHKDIPNFAEGIKIALRKNPNIIFVGETRDKETVEILLQASETGHLTVTTLHLSNPIDVITRLKNLFKNEELINDYLSKNLNGVITIKLIKWKIENTEVIIPVFSLLYVNDFIKVILSKKDNTTQLMNLWTDFNMIKKWILWPKEASLLYLYKQLNAIDEKTLLQYSDPDILERIQWFYDKIFIQKL